MSPTPHCPLPLCWSLETAYLWEVGQNAHAALVNSHGTSLFHGCSTLLTPGVTCIQAIHHRGQPGSESKQHDTNETKCNNNNVTCSINFCLWISEIYMKISKAPCKANWFPTEVKGSWKPKESESWPHPWNITQALIQFLTQGCILLHSHRGNLTLQCHWDRRMQLHLACIQ